MQKDIDKARSTAIACFGKVTHLCLLPMSDTTFYSYAETLAAQRKNNGTASQSATSTPLVNLDYAYITTSSDLADATADIAACSVLAIDTETTGLDPHTDRIRLVQVATQDYATLVIDLWYVKDWTPLKNLLQNQARKVFHTLKFDWQFLHQAGLPVAAPFFDTQLAYKVWRSGIKGKSNLAVVVQRFLGVELDKTLQVSDWNRPNLSPEQIRYAAWDAAYQLAIFRPLVKKLRQRGKRWNADLLKIARLESDCAPATAWMELNGMGLDTERLELALATFRVTRQTTRTQFQAALGEVQPQQIRLFGNGEGNTFGTNPGSSQQVIKSLAAQGLRLTSTNQRSLIKVVDKHPSLPHLLEWRRVAKLVDQVESLPRHVHPKTQRLHPSIFQMGARSGRFSCRNPALQTIPRHQQIRQCFTAAPGYVLVKADYSQIELRIIAKLTRDPLLVKAYCTRQDVHRLTASLLMHKSPETVTSEERRVGKSINFGLIYGMSAVRLQMETQLKYGVLISHAAALAFQRQFFALFKGIDQWHRRTKRLLYSKNQRTACTLLGRARQWQALPSFNEFVNFPVQGTSADLTKLALVKLLPHLSDQIRLVIVVHDEIVLEVEEAIAQDAGQLLTRCMVDTASPILQPIPVKVDVTIGQSWGGD